MILRNSAVVLLSAVLFVGPAYAAKRHVSLLIDNHIVYVDRPFVFDEDVLRQSIRDMLTKVRPEQVIVFAVGHDGHAQYPSDHFPHQAPSPSYPFLKEPGQDLLRIWREETDRADTRMIVYVSTLRNDALARSRPEWLRVHGNGLPATVIDHNSAFLEEVLLPGLQEIIDRYQPDGFFLDADYWTVHESWNEASTKLFTEATGLPVPRSYSDPSYGPFVRHAYETYRENYVTRLADFFAGNGVDWTINGAYTIRDPYPVPPDYGAVSVDIPSFFALQEGYLESLFAQRLDTGAEIMVPLFGYSEGAQVTHYKGEAQLKQELAVAVANRLPISFYLPLEITGEIDLDHLEPALKVYDAFDRAFGLDAGDGELVAPVAVVNDPHLDRDLNDLRSVSLDLFERGIPFAITTRDRLATNRYQHVIDPRNPPDLDQIQVSAPVTFPDKPDYIYALSYEGDEGLTVFLSSVAWGGYAFGRHSLYDSAPQAPAMTMELREPMSCTQRTLDGAVDLPQGQELTTHPFDTITKIECTQ